MLSYQTTEADLFAAFAAVLAFLVVPIIAMIVEVPPRELPTLLRSPEVGAAVLVAAYLSHERGHQPVTAYRLV